MNHLKDCEIEAIGVSYSIYTHHHETHPFFFDIFHKRNKDNHPTHHQIEPAATPTGHVNSSSSSTTTHRRRVLTNVNCRAKAWEILAIVGPSGAGKSTLLQILAGKLTPDHGSLLVNGAPATAKTANHFKKISGYVTQRDTLFPLLTVEETLLFSARLRLNLPTTDLRARVHSLLTELGLSHVAGSRVGGGDTGCSGGGIRGVSGGERRRVSIGVEVVHEPKVLILDEPTSGLDSSSALQIVDMLKSMAEKRGRTIVLTIHQPGFRIVKLFNSVLLLANGTVVEHGTVDQLASTIHDMGLQLPPRVNLVEFAIDSIEKFVQRHCEKGIIGSDSEVVMEQLQNQNQNQNLAVVVVQDQQMQAQRKSRRTLQQLFQQSKVAADEENLMETMEITIDKELPRHESSAVSNGFDFTYANSRWEEIVILSHRFSKIVFRTKELFACRTLQMLISGLVLGSIFYNLSDDLSGAMERAGLFAFILTFLLSCTVEALPIFLQEREILMKETSCGSYRVSSYIIANSVVYLPFSLILAALFAVPVYWMVGLNGSFTAFVHFVMLIWLILYTANSVVVCCSALVPDFVVGNSVISGVMGSFFLFSGYFIPKDEIPGYWIGLHYASLFKYPYEDFLINEFGKGGRSGGEYCVERVFGACVLSGDDLLRDQGVVEDNRWRNVGVMVCFIVLYRFVAYVVLRCRCSQRGSRLRKNPFVS